MSEDRSRQWWAVVRSALTWGAAWGIAGGGIIAVLTLFSPGPGVESLVERLGMTLLAGASWGFRFGVVGAVVGTLFATALRLGYRGRRLAQINPVWFTLLGAVVGGAGVPLFLQLMNVLTGGSTIAWGLVRFDAILGAVFGAVAAGGSILLARRAGEQEPDQLNAVTDDPDRLTAGPMDGSSSAWIRKEDEQRLRR
jgi:hypothetical protein